MNPEPIGFGFIISDLNPASTINLRIIIRISFNERERYG